MPATANVCAMSSLCRSENASSRPITWGRNQSCGMAIKAASKYRCASVESSGMRALQSCDRFSTLVQKSRRPRRPCDQDIAAIFRRFDGRLGRHGPAASHVEALHAHIGMFMSRRIARQTAVALPSDAQNLCAHVLPAPMLDPKSGAVAVLNIETIDAHVESPPLVWSVCDGLEPLGASAAKSASAAWALFARLGFVDGESAAIDLLPVHRRDRRLRFLIRTHLNESESFAAAGFPIADHLGALH